MENLNLEGKRLSEIVDDAHSKGMKVVLIEEPIFDGHARISAMINSESFMVIGVKNLTEEDQKEIAPFLEKEKPTIILRARPKLEDLPVLPIIEGRSNGYKSSFMVDPLKIISSGHNQRAKNQNYNRHNNYRRKH